MPEQLGANEFSANDFGYIAYSLLKGLFSSDRPARPDDNILEHVRQGRWTFLFARDRRFIENSI